MDDEKMSVTAAKKFVVGFREATGVREDGILAELLKSTRQKNALKSGDDPLGTDTDRVAKPSAGFER